jgi:hypothetical protein
MSPLLFADLLGIYFPTLNPEDVKVHFRKINKEVPTQEHPLIEFMRGSHLKTESWQANPNFERPYMLSFYPLFGKGVSWGEQGIPEEKPSTWIFTGLYRVLGKTEGEDPDLPGRLSYLYDLQPARETESLIGRATVWFDSTVRNTRRVGENVLPTLEVHGYTRYPLDIP